MTGKVLVLLCAGLLVLALGCSGGKKAAPTAAPVATSTPTVAASSGGNGVTGDTSLLQPQPELALAASLEAVSGFDITSVVFRGNDVTVKYEQVVSEPSELLLLRWLDFATVATTFLEEPLGQITIVPVVENTDIASIRMRAVDVVDYIDGKRTLEDVLASIVIE